MIGDEDLDGCFSAADFGVEAIFETAGGTVAVTGHFTEGSDAVEIYETQIEAVGPSFTGRTSVLEGIRRNDTATISGRTFTVERHQKVGTGVSVVYLKT